VDLLSRIIANKCENSKTHCMISYRAALYVRGLLEELRPLTEEGVDYIMVDYI